MAGSIKTLQLDSGEVLINVPADRPTLISLGFSETRADELCEDAVRTDTLESMVVARRVLYEVQADPLFLEWQYDETPEKEKAWRNKVAEIKALYPLPGRI